MEWLIIIIIVVLGIGIISAINKQTNIKQKELELRRQEIAAKLVKSQSFLPLLRIIVADSSADSCELAEISSS